MCNFMGKEQFKGFGPQAFDTPTNSDKKTGLAYAI